jgi:hypothetical protein
VHQGDANGHQKAERHHAAPEITPKIIQSLKAKYTREAMSKRWTEESRKRQSELIMNWKAWTSTTGPKTPKGKKRASKNSTKTGEHCAELRLLRRMLAEHNQQLRDLDRRTN